MDDKYSCLKCTNAATPMCTVCLHVQTPSGAVKKPSLFSSIEKDDKTSNVTNVTAKILEYISQEKPVPVCLVIYYNKLVGKKEV